jgi:Domain of unknown function (DUF5069)
MDEHWLHFTGISAEALKAELEKGKGDGEILAWVQQHAPQKREAWEIQFWSTFHNEREPDSDAETLGFYSGVSQFSKVREDIKTWFDLLDLDDHVTFGGDA